MRLRVTPVPAEHLGIVLAQKGASSVNSPGNSEKRSGKPGTRNSPSTRELASRTLLSTTKSWFMGTNIPGKKPALVLYANSAANYRKECAEVAAKNYEGFVLA